MMTPWLGWFISHVDDYSLIGWGSQQLSEVFYLPVKLQTPYIYMSSVYMTEIVTKVSVFLVGWIFIQVVIKHEKSWKVSCGDGKFYRRRFQDSILEIYMGFIVILYQLN